MAAGGNAATERTSGINSPGMEKAGIDPIIRSIALDAFQCRIDFMRFSSGRRGEMPKETSSPSSGARRTVGARPRRRKASLFCMRGDDHRHQRSLAFTGDQRTRQLAAAAHGTDFPALAAGVDLPGSSHARRRRAGRCVPAAHPGRPATGSASGNRDWPGAACRAAPALPNTLLAAMSALP